MRVAIILTIVFLTFSTFANQSQNYYAIPKKNNIGVYKNPIRKLNERALFIVSLENRLIIIEEKKNAYKIRDEKDRIGWIEKRMVTKQKRSKHYDYGNVHVEGYIDIPSVIYIHDTDQKLETLIELDRSFKDHLSNSVDRECIERQTK